jgi:hypothetical protein
MIVGIIYAYWELRAKELAKAIEDSFGKVANLRKAVKDAHGEWVPDLDGVSVWKPYTHKATMHKMPDGVKVQMPYFKVVDIHGRPQEHGSVAPDVEMKVRGETMKFNRITFRTQDVDLARHGRTGFVNMIQATDAQLARLIIRHLDNLGVKNIIAVHDCFRVGVHDIDKLKAAIKAAYFDLFGTVSNVKSKGWMPNGTDIVGMYFQGVNKSKEHQSYVYSQFESGERTLHDSMMDMPELIDGLGVTTSYFSK